MPRLGLWIASAAILLSACAGPGALPSIEDLRARTLADPENVEALRTLGARLAIEGEYGPALGTLDRADRLEPGDGETLYILGLVHEALGRTDGAEAVYARYLIVPDDDVYRDSLRARLDGLVTARLRQEFASARASEDSVTAVTRTGAIGVLPFAYRGTDDTYAALGRGLAEVLSVDLGSIESLTIVERARLQALLREVELARRGILNASTAPRVGLLLQASRLIGGEVDVQGETLRIDSAVWEGSLQGIETTEGDMSDLFAVQKTTTIQVLDALGVELTEDQEARLRAAPTDDLEAFLLYSRALLQEDVGDYLGAARLYDQALARDPGFALASRRRSEARLFSQATGPAPPRILTAGTSTLRALTVAATNVVQLRSNALRGIIGQNLTLTAEAREAAIEAYEAFVAYEDARRARPFPR
ncbi:MAG: CsgG/HfaB family protein [Bacteroidota bacterium]